MKGVTTRVVTPFSDHKKRPSTGKPFNRIVELLSVRKLFHFCFKSFFELFVIVFCLDAFVLR